MEVKSFFAQRTCRILEQAEAEDAEPEDRSLEDAEAEEDAKAEDPSLEDAEVEEDSEAEDPSLEDHFPGLYLTLKNRPAILEDTDTSDVSFHGRIRPDATECVVSFPGKFASGWDALIEESYEQSVACVFLCRPEDGLGQHSTNPEAPPGASVTCYCPTIYGERNFKEFGYLYWLPKGCSSDKEKRVREKAKYTNAVVVRANADEKEKLEAERQAKEAWEQSGRTASWGCRSKSTLLPTSYTSPARPPYIPQKFKKYIFPPKKSKISKINSRMIFIQKYPRNYCSISSQIAYKFLLCFFVKMCFAKLHFLTVHLQTSHSISI